MFYQRNFTIYYPVEQHRLYPLGGVVGGYQEEPELCESSREKAYYIETLLHEGPGVAKSVNVSARPVGGGSKPLTLWVLPHVFFGIINHFGPVAHLVDGLVGEGSPPA